MFIISIKTIIAFNLFHLFSFSSHPSPIIIFQKG
nr:MAG TPA: hypothetical protein [Caudoviricetes sp.]